MAGEGGDGPSPAPVPVRHRCDPAALSLPPMPEHRRYLHWERTIIAGTCTGTGASPVPAPRPEYGRYLTPGPEHCRYLRYLHRDRGSPKAPAHGLSGRGARPVRSRAKRRAPFPPSSAGRSPDEAGGRWGLLQPHRGQPGKAAPELRACFKSQIASDAGARPPPREQCAGPGPPPPAIARPWVLAKGGGKPNQIFPSSNIWGPSPRRGPGAAGKAEKTRVEIIRSDLFPWSDSSFEQLPNGSFCLSESFSSRFCSD